MAAYLLKRLVMTLVVVLAVMVFLSVLVHIVPGDPVTIVLGPQASPDQIKVVRAEMWLDHSVPAQVWHYIAGALHGDLGQDFLSGQPVSHMIAEAIPHTVVLAVVALALAALLGIPLGVFAARHQNSWVDRLLGVVSVGFVAIPSYVLALFLLLVFAVSLHVLPAIGAGSFADPVDYARHLILPACSLGIAWIGYIARLVRTGMLSELGSNYIRSARSLGIGDRITFYKWALKNAIVPTIAVLGTGLGHLLGGAVLIEMIFSRPGLGRLTVEAIEQRNFPIVQGAVLVTALLYVATNLLADLSYRLVDPRIRVEQSAEGA